MTEILVVDDEPAVVAGLQALLDLHGLQAVGASDCETAEACMASEFFPIILADLRMRGDEDGLHLIEAARRLSPRSRVATMTAYATAAMEQRLRESGAALVLYKPFDEEQLIAALAEMLGAIESAEHEHRDDDDALYRATVGTLHAVARGRFGFTREDAEELIQETWLLYLEKRRDIRTPRSWLTGTVANLCRQEIERRQKDRARNTEMPDLSCAPSHDAVLAVRTALATLDDRSRALCTLIGIEQLSYNEVAAATQLPIGSIGPLYMRAKSRLRMALG